MLNSPNHSRRTLAVCGITAAVEAVLHLNIAEPALLFFVLGPPAFLGLIAWRRRAHMARSRRLSGVAFGIGAFGIAAFAVAILQVRDNPQPERPSIAPLAVPLVQWIVVLYVWLAIVRQESREKRERQADAVEGPHPSGS